MDAARVLIDIHARGGAFYVARGANVLLFHHDFDKILDDTPSALFRVAVDNSASIVLYPKKSITDYHSCPVRPVVDAFLRTNTRPSYVFTVKIVSSAVISDGTIYVATNIIKDTEKELAVLLKEKKPWLYVKNDETGSDAMLGSVVKDIMREQALLVACIVMSESGLKNTMPEFLSMLSSFCQQRQHATTIGMGRGNGDWSDIA